ncbi:MAG: hypothetical protein PHX49_07210 [Bacteroidales bacterium]|nr:hypothetical protein [Bacteroidales bacterium]
MKLSYLPLLVDGKIPEDDNYVILNKNRKKEVKSAEFKSFISGVPSNYDISDIYQDITNLDGVKDSKLYKFVNDFETIGFVFGVLFFILYWIIFGFWWGLITGGILIILAFIIDKHLGGLFDLSKDSKRLLENYDELLQRLSTQQKQENKQNQKK